MDESSAMAAVSLLAEQRRWRSRDVRYFAGTWQQVLALLPEFDLQGFSAEADGPANPFFKTVVRQPLTLAERPIPVGLVSKAYRLVQHREVGDLCIQTLAEAGFPADTLKCQAGISELGEWVNLRFELPPEFSFAAADGHVMTLRVEAFNSVDGSARLTVLTSWFRQICSNGLVVRGTKTEISDKHNQGLDLEAFKGAIANGLAKAAADRGALTKWQESIVSSDALIAWADDAVVKRWGVKAATRVLHICESAYDVRITDPFEGGKASQRNVLPDRLVPGSRVPARNLYDVAQALSWVASTRTNAEQRVMWQSDIPRLVRALGQEKKVSEPRG